MCQAAMFFEGCFMAKIVCSAAYNRPSSLRSKGTGVPRENAWVQLSQALLVAFCMYNMQFLIIYVQSLCACAFNARCSVAFIGLLVLTTVACNSCGCVDYDGCCYDCRSVIRWLKIDFRRKKSQIRIRFSSDSKSLVIEGILHMALCTPTWLDLDRLAVEVGAKLCII